MHHVDPALLTIVWATAAGLFAQLLGARWRVPAIVPLLILGVALGPSGLDVVRPATLGHGLSVLVKLAAAIILFDGALNLRLADLRRALAEVRSLATVGILVTWIGATAAAWGIARLRFPLAVIFGALVSVTGPTSRCCAASTSDGACARCSRGRRSSPTRSGPSSRWPCSTS
jgi:NhaP-type Na+/H+ or K+/H+ antiporter